MATIGFEEKLWEAADKLRNNMDAVRRQVSVAYSKLHGIIAIILSVEYNVT